MKDELFKLVESGQSIGQKKNIIREYLQLYILRSLYNNNFFQYCAFHGGTCLRFVYDIKRFSEDLDFALVEDRRKFDFDKIIHKVKSELKDAGYSVGIKSKKKTVLSTLFRFSDLLYELNLSNRKEEYFSIKIEIDTEPPSKGTTQINIVNKYFMLGLKCYTLPTLYAGKINAILTRSYIKGRDYYDLFWYLITYKEMLPDFNFLKNSLTQFGWKGNFPDSSTWKQKLTDVILKAEWEIIRDDVELLLEDINELKLFTKENLLNLLT